MKGLIVQAGESKSIVLLNNGKIMSIKTPANCHVGMVVSVKYNSIIRILITIIAAIILIALGIFIGAKYFGNIAGTDPRNLWRGRHMHRHMMEMRQL
jgi:uncharacterized protein YneF (UPF0154 family)